MGNRRVRLRVEQPITADYQEIERGEYDGEGAVRARKKAAQIRILSGISNWAAGGIDAAGGDTTRK